MEQEQAQQNLPEIAYRDPQTFIDYCATLGLDGQSIIDRSGHVAVTATEGQLD